MLYMPARRALAPLALVCALTGTGAHAAMDALVNNAIALQKQGQAQSAFDLLDKEEIERAGDPDFDTIFGIVANETGNYSRAILALERVLSVQPGHPRVRAELGRALFAVGDNKAARTLFQEARQDTQVPAGAALTIDQFLSAIDKVEDAGRSSVRGYIEGGFGYDTNVNSGPSGANVAVPAFGGLVLTLAPSGVKTESSFASLGGGVSGRLVLDPRWSLTGGASVSTRPNTSAVHNLDTAQADANGGVAWRHERHEVTVAAQAGTFTFDNRALRNQFGGTAEWIYRFDGFRQMNTYLQYARLHYPGQELRDTDRTVIGTSYAHQFRSGNLAFGGVYLGREATRANGVDQLGHHLMGLRGGVQMPIGRALAAFGTLGLERRKFGGDDPFFLVRREDRQSTLNLGLLWEPAPKWRVTPQLTLARVDSNSPVADFHKAVISVSARRDF